MNPTPVEPREFTDEELLAALERMGEEVEREAFAAGQPYVVMRGSDLVWIYPDGHEARARIHSGDMAEVEP